MHILERTERKSVQRRSWSSASKAARARYVVRPYLSLVVVAVVLCLIAAAVDAAAAAAMPAADATLITSCPLFFSVLTIRPAMIGANWEEEKEGAVDTQFRVCVLEYT